MEDIGDEDAQERQDESACRDRAATIIASAKQAARRDLLFSRATLFRFVVFEGYSLLVFSFLVLCKKPQPSSAIYTPFLSHGHTPARIIGIQTPSRPASSRRRIARRLQMK